MARRRHSELSHLESIPSVRVSQSVIANRVRLDLDRYAASLARLQALHAANLLSQVEDQRRFHPDPIVRPRTLAGKVARVGALSMLGSQQKVFRSVAPPVLPVFDLSIKESPQQRVDRQTQQWNLHIERSAMPHAQKLVECLRRKAQREVLHAKRIAGSRSRIRRTRRKTSFYGVEC